MRLVGHALLAVCALSLAASAEAQMGMAMGGGRTPVVSVLTPTGNLAKVATTGIGVALYSAFGRDDATWGSRLTIGLERFTGKEPIKSIQYMATGFNVVHRSERWYQFGGFSFSSGRTNYAESAPTTGRRTSGSDIGLTGGLGLQLGAPGDQVRTFFEAGYVNVFRDDGNDTWVPVRFGIRF